MANHGITTVGNTVADAYDRLYYIERAAQVQLYAMWTGQPLKQLPAAVVEKTKRDIGGAGLYEGASPAHRHVHALKRVPDRQKAGDSSLNSLVKRGAAGLHSFHRKTQEPGGAP